MTQTVMSAFEQAVAAIKAAAQEGETPEEFVARALAQAKADMLHETMTKLYGPKENA